MLARVFFLAVVVIGGLFQHCCSTKTISCRVENQFDDKISVYKSLKPKGYQKSGGYPAKDLEDNQFTLFQPILV